MNTKNHHYGFEVENREVRKSEVCVECRTPQPYYATRTGWRGDGVQSHCARPRFTLSVAIILLQRNFRDSTVRTMVRYAP